MTTSKTSSNDLAKDRTDLAKERTDYAEDRTLMANERTLGGWMRTGLACLGIALGFEALFGRFDPAWMPKSIATSFVIIAILIFISAYRRARTVLKRLSAHETEAIPTTNIALITSVLCLGAVALGAGIWLFNWQS
ncbi:YidH family protein [Robiginitomaculum antarcticum]|uniref:YidH family protein n=1 Tax=Robiginitomaculum antarcticum TaxID=437507 RepID=UPI0003804C85|nr:DUF202 domain-containing protein [Robiginitomaculum antarcticum]